MVGALMAMALSRVAILFSRDDAFYMLCGASLTIVLMLVISVSKYKYLCPDYQSMISAGILFILCIVFLIWNNFHPSKELIYVLYIFGLVKMFRGTLTLSPTSGYYNAHSVGSMYGNYSGMYKGEGMADSSFWTSSSSYDDMEDGDWAFLDKTKPDDSFCDDSKVAEDDLEESTEILDRE